MKHAVPSNNKLKLLHLLRILRRETDETNPIPAAALCERLEACGQSCERKAIYRDIKALNDFGFEVLSTRSPWQGFFLAGRELQPPEVRLLLDAIASAPFISESKTEALTAKLCSCLSQRQEALVRQQVCVPMSSHYKCDNEEVYYSIDAIHQAISKNCKIEFSYYHKEISNGVVKNKAARSFRISPYAMVWNEDKYYLVGNYEKYDDLSNYRIDRMRRVKLLPEEEARPLQEVSKYTDGFDSADYLRTSFSMFSNDSEELVTLSCKNHLLDAMVDRFGAITILEQGEDSFTFQAPIRCGEGFYTWALRWRGDVLVLEPDAVREAVIDHIRDLADAYCEL